MKRYLKYIKLAAVFSASIFSQFSTLHAEGATTDSKMTTQRAARAPSQQSKLGGVLNIDMPKGELSPLIYVSLQDDNMDWWYKIPSNSGPYISDTKKIFFGQNFNIFALVANSATSADKKFKLKYSIKLKKPDGSEVSIVQNVPFDGDKPNPDMILACPDVANLRLDEKSGDGKYEVIFDVADEISGQKKTVAAKFYTYKWTPPNPYSSRKIVREKLRGFYEEPSPEILYSIFFSKELELEQKSAPNSLNYSHLGFLRSAFKRNAFLIPYIRGQFENATPLDRAKIILLMSILKEPEFEASKLSEAEKNYQRQLRAVSVPDAYDPWNPVYAAAQADMLWGEFYATGAYRPLRRIIDLIGYTEEAAFSDKLRAQRRKPSTPEQWRKFMLGITSRAALTSLAENYNNSDLVAKYVEWALQNGDIPPKTKKLLIGEEPAGVKPSASDTAEKKRGQTPEIKAEAKVPAKSGAAKKSEK